MAQIFSRRTLRFPLYAGLGAPVALAAVVGFFWYYGSPSYTDVGYRPKQPVPYSHKLHVGQLDLDCRYCHTSVEESPVATLPPTQICMNCHHVIQRDSPLLEPIRTSFEENTPVRWVRVHDLPDYAYFDHSLHLRAGVGCSSCHGEIQEMDVVQQREPLSMKWCLDCHRQPEPYLRPADAVTDMLWAPGRDQPEVAAQIIEAKRLHPPEDCTGCHR